MAKKDPIEAGRAHPIAVLLKSWESFYTRRLFHRIQDCWARPISSAPGAYIDVMERSTSDNNCTLFTTGESKKCLNLGSYNYLGFADDWNSTCKDQVLQSVNKWPNSLCSSRMDLGTSVIHEQLEKLVAE